MSYDHDYFDGVYEEGDGDPWGYYDSEYEQEKVDRTVAALRDAHPPGRVDAVLDLGCGNGAKTRSVARAYPNADVLGIDCSGAALATARERAPGPSYERSDLLEFVGETDRTFDAVVAVESLHYLGADHGITRLLSFADDLREVLADDGVLVATHLVMPRGEGPVFAQDRSTRVLRAILETAFEEACRSRYDERKTTALDPDEPEYQPYEVWTMLPLEAPPARGA